MYDNKDYSKDKVCGARGANCDLKDRKQALNITKSYYIYSITIILKIA